MIEIFDEIAKYLEFVAISIVADIVPLNDENRILAFYGLQKITILISNLSQF